MCIHIHTNVVYMYMIVYANLYIYIYIIIYVLNLLKLWTFKEHLPRSDTTSGPATFLHASLVTLPKSLVSPASASDANVTSEGFEARLVGGFSPPL